MPRGSHRVPGTTFDTILATFNPTRKACAMNRPLVIDQALFELGLLPSSRANEIAECAAADSYESEAIIELASVVKRDARWAETNSGTWEAGPTAASR